MNRHKETHTNNIVHKVINSMRKMKRMEECRKGKCWKVRIG